MSSWKGNDVAATSCPCYNRALHKRGLTGNVLHVRLWKLGGERSRCRRKDQDERRDHRDRLGPSSLVPLLSLAALGFRSHEVHTLFLFLSAWDIWHVLMQHYGFMRIYDAKQGATHPLPARLDWMVSLWRYLTLTLVSSIAPIIRTICLWRCPFQPWIDPRRTRRERTGVVSLPHGASNRRPGSSSGRPGGYRTTLHSGVALELKHCGEWREFILASFSAPHRGSVLHTLDTPVVGIFTRPHRDTR